MDGTYEGPAIQNSDQSTTLPALKGTLPIFNLQQNTNAARPVVVQKGLRVEANMIRLVTTHIGVTYYGDLRVVLATKGICSKAAGHHLPRTAAHSVWRLPFLNASKRRGMHM